MNTVIQAFDSDYQNTMLNTSFLRKFKELSTEGYLKVRREVRGDLDTFRATQYETYRKEGYYPMFKRGNGQVGTFIEMTMLQSAMILFHYDQVLPAHEVIIKEVVRNRVNPLESVKKGESLPLSVFNDTQLASDYSFYNHDKRVLELKKLLSGIKLKHAMLIALGDGSGVCQDAARQLGLKCYSIDSSKQMCTEAKFRGFDVECKTIDQVMDMRFQGTVIYVLSDILSYVPNLVYRLRDKKVLIYEPNGIYPDIDLVKPLVPQTWMYATNLSLCGESVEYVSPGWDPQRTTDFMMNPDVIVRFKRFCFVGPSSLRALRFLLLLDPHRRNTYESVGIGTQQMGYDAGFTGSRLIVVDGYYPNLGNFVTKNDVVYNLAFKREMSFTLLSKILPFMGYVSLEFLGNIGFNCNTPIPDAIELDDGLVSIAHVTDMEKGLSYLIPEGKFAQFVNDSRMLDSECAVSVTDFHCGFKMFVPHKRGYLSYSAKCVHSESAVGLIEHHHTRSIVDTVVVETGAQFFHRSKALLEVLPVVFSETGVKNYLISYLHRNEVAVNAFVLALNMDKRVYCSHAFYFNPLGISQLFESDIAKLNLQCSLMKETLTGVLNSMFSDMFLKVVIENGQHLCVNATNIRVPIRHLYEVKGGMMLDVDSFRAEYTSSRVMEVIEFDKHDEKKNPRDILFFEFKKRKKKLTWIGMNALRMK
jgi:hypothetical protein